MFRALPVAAFLLLAAAGVSGCGGSDEVTGNVSGKVTLDGQPVTTGSISFISGDGKVGNSDISASGEYKIENLSVGNFKVVVSPPPLPHPGMPGTKRMAGQAEFPGHPKKYRSDLTTDLSAQVDPGENNFDFDMKAESGRKK